MRRGRESLGLAARHEKHAQPLALYSNLIQNISRPSQPGLASFIAPHMVAIADRAGYYIDAIRALFESLKNMM